MIKAKKFDPFKNLILDKEEQKIEDALEKGEFVRASDFEETKMMFEEAAKNYPILQKTERITLRVKNDDLIKVKAKAKKVNIPYQRLLNALIHKFAENEVTLHI